MNQRLSDSYNDFENMLLLAAKYSGNKEGQVKRFSASMLGNDPLQNFLKFKHGSGDSTQFEANTFGSIYQLGVDLACTQFNAGLGTVRYISALRLSHTLPNGWEVSGEMDQIDTKLRIVFDNKVTTATTLAKLRKEGKMHQYALQLGVYKWLLKKNNIEYAGEYDDYLTAISLVDKGFSYFKPLKNNQLEFVEVHTYEPEDIELMLIEATDRLDEHIELDEAPAKCANLFPYRAKGQSMKNMRCLFYCDQATNCPYFSRQNPNAILNAMMDL